MKRKQLIIATLAIGLLATAYKVADDIITRLGMEQQYAQRNIINNLVGNFSGGPIDPYAQEGNDVYSQTKSFQIPYIPKPKFALLISGDKAGAAKELCEYVKKFINSEEFMEQYLKAREEAMPLTDKGSSLATLKRNKEVFETNIRNYKTDTKYVAQQTKLMEENQKKIDGILEAAKKPFPGKEKWEKMFPTDPSALIKKRLQEYLTLAATVDFNAKLTEPDKYRVKKFVNPAYEKKSLKWKAIYRAGKEVNDVVVPFVKEWLKGEIIAKEKTSMAENNDSKPATTTNSNTVKNNSPTNTNSNPVADNTDAPADKPAEPAKEKKSLFKKLKEKIGQ